MTPRWRAAFVVVGLLFWLLRIVYWSTTDEALFSDMADFHGIAERFAAGGTLAMDDFWQSYRSPVLPWLGALQLTLFGNGMLPWQILQTAILFAGACWLARELRHATGGNVLPLAWLLIVALGKSSIFWSLKFAKEGLHEALLYVVIAAVLRLLRRPSWPFAFVVGALTFVAALNRSNFVVALLLIPCGILLAARLDDTTIAMRLRRALSQLAAFALGAFLVWLPWGVRTYRLYGRPLLMTTDGAAVALDGHGQIEVTQPDGSPLVIRYQQFLHEAPQRFANDAEADAWLGHQIVRWARNNPGRCLGDVAGNALRSARSREIFLTHVPRDHLLPRWLDWLLLDKHKAATWLGLLGLLAIGLLQRRLVMLTHLTVAPWLIAILLLGLPRMFEPIIPLVLFGNVCLVAECVEITRLGAARRRAAAAIL